MQYSVLEKDNELCITLNRRFRNLLSLIEHYLTDDSLGKLIVLFVCFISLLINISSGLFINDKVSIFQTFVFK